jgi:hypothetical protein
MRPKQPFDDRDNVRRVINDQNRGFVVHGGMYSNTVLQFLFRLVGRSDKKTIR